MIGSRLSATIGNPRKTKVDFWWKPRDLILVYGQWSFGLSEASIGVTLVGWSGPGMRAEILGAQTWGSDPIRSFAGSGSVIMRKAVIIVISVLALAAVPANASAGKLCGSVTFEPNSDYTDGNIRAQNIGCPRAIAVAVRWTVEGTKTTPYGFRCRYHVVNQALRMRDVRCVRGPSVVTFSAS